MLTRACSRRSRLSRRLLAQAPRQPSSLLKHVVRLKKGRMKAPSTSELLRARAFGIATDQDAVTWAIGQIAVSPASPQLAALCTLRAPLNHFEVEDLLRGALSEIDVREQEPRRAYWSYLYEVSSEIVSGAMAPGDGCDLLARAHGGALERVEIQSFWMLRMAHADLQESQVQFYWPDLTTDNYGARVIEQALALQRLSCTELGHLAGQ